MSMASGKLWDDVSASDTYRRHVIALILDAPDPGTATAMEAALQPLAASIQWSHMERKLEGQVRVRTAGSQAGLLIVPPLFRPRLAERIEALLNAAMDIGQARH